jgi:predicted O-linked N-acetylglucosamine transferase (SPINDLY family)
LRPLIGLCAMSQTTFLAAIQKITAGGLTLEEALAAAGGLSPDEGRQLYQVWISFNKDHPLLFIALFNCSTLQQQLGDEAGGEESLRAALALKPDFAPACINLGSSLERRGLAKEAVEQWRDGLDKMASVTADSINYKVTLLKQISRLLSDGQALAAAEITLTQCLELAPEARDVAEQFVAARLSQCKWPMTPENGKFTRRGLVSRLHPLSVCAYTDDPLFQLAAADKYVRTMSPIEDRSTRFDRRSAPIETNRRLRIGYVSSDLRHHAVGYLMVNFFEEHDRKDFEVFAYYTGIKADDPIQTRIKASVDHWRDIRGVTDDEAAAKIAEDCIDILVDVNGHTRDARLGVFARRPAPVQVNWLGYPGTMGSSFHQYIVADDWTIPEHAEAWYSERVLRLPCYQPNDRKRIIDETVPTRADFGLPDNAFVFCCFNASHKFTRFNFDRWMDILKQSDNSVLWLLDYTPETNQRLREQAEARGVSGDRLIFAPKLPNPRHLARYPLADLFLDSVPYGAHTTASDALWMGVPVLTWSGRCFASRVCGSLLRAAGLTEMVCETPEAFVTRAIHLAGPGRGELEITRARLLANRETCTLFDVAKLSRHLERLYRQMRDEYISGALPQPRLGNLDSYFEIGVAQDHEVREMGALTDYEGFYYAQLARRHYHQPMDADGRLWNGEEHVEPIAAAKKRSRAA